MIRRIRRWWRRRKYSDLDMLGLKLVEARGTTLSKPAPRAYTAAASPVPGLSGMFVGAEDTAGERFGVIGIWLSELPTWDLNVFVGCLCEVDVHETVHWAMAQSGEAQSCAGDHAKRWNPILRRCLAWGGVGSTPNAGPLAVDA